MEEDQTTTRGGDHQNIQIEFDRAFAGESKSNITKQASKASMEPPRTMEERYLEGQNYLAYNTDIGLDD